MHPSSLVCEIELRSTLDKKRLDHVGQTLDQQSYLDRRRLRRFEPHPATIIERNRDAVALKLRDSLLGLTFRGWGKLDRLARRQRLRPLPGLQLTAEL